MKLMFVVELDDEGIRNHWTSYPDLAASDARSTFVRSSAVALIREAIACWELNGMIKGEAKGWLKP